MCASLAVGSHAFAQSTTTGAISGRVVDAKTKEPLVGVAVVVESTSTHDSQTAITEADGTYKITELLPGTYTVKFIAEGSTATQRNVRVGVNDTVPVFQELREGAIVIEGKAPQINLNGTDLSKKIGRAEIETVPNPSRTADGVAASKAGAHNDGVGIAFAGSTGLENRFLVDGIDITGLTLGNVGSPVLTDFVEEIEVLSGGFNAEWGRAIGGIVNIVTKTGTNQFRGSVFGNYAPGFLTRAREAAPTNAASIDITGDRAYNADFGFDLGGPLIKDRLWFYVGVAPQASRTNFTRVTKRQTDCRKQLPSGELSECDPRIMSQGGFADGSPDIDPRTGFFITDEIDREVRSSSDYGLSAVGKLNLAVTPEHQAQISAIVTPGYGESAGLLGLPDGGSKSTSMTLDGAARWTSKFDGNRSELEATVAWHHSTLKSGALDPALDNEPAQVLHNGNLGVWGAMGGESAKTIAACTDGAPGSGDLYPAITNCPMDSLPYVTGGPGRLFDDSEDRLSARIATIRRGRLAGSHEIKAGIDVNDNAKTLTRRFSGGALINNFVGPGFIEVQRFVALKPPDSTDPRFDQTCRTPATGGDGMLGGGVTSFSCDYLGGTAGSPGTEVKGQTIDWAVYLRDSWRPVSNLTINLGLRYEQQQLRFAEELRNKVDPLTGNFLGTNAMNLTNNWAPRLGVVWDPTNVGKSKLWASYGRFFEAIPMDINDRSFGGELSYRQLFRTSGGKCGDVDPRFGGANGINCLDKTQADDEQLIGSSGVLVAPGIKSQYLDESVIGAEYQLGTDTKVGAVFQRRWLGRVIEDVSTDGAQTYIIANPGEWDPAAERALEQQIDQTTDDATRRRLENQLALFRGIRRFDRPQRNYGALELSVTRRFADGVLASASYTYSHTAGNFPGSVSYDNGQRDPNISSQYDLIELLANREGRLPQDRPHSIKIDASKQFKFSDKHAMVVGTRARLVSGIPKNALGAHYLYGPDESFLLPRGTLGRTDLEHSIDLRLAYARQISATTRAELFIDVFNLLNKQGTFDVDRTYAPAVMNTPDGGVENNANPISGGGYDDLVFAKRLDGSGRETSQPVGRNPNFGNTATRYAPSSAQIGFRVTF